MFAPTKVWRRWHRRINQGQRRYATCSALAASALPSLVMARGHKIEKVPEVPLVVSNKALKDISKTKQAVKLLKDLGAYDDIEKVKSSHKIRRGKGKMRNRRYVQRRGPLVVYGRKTPLIKALRNIPGVELVCVTRLNLLQLAPGGHLGRFCIWTKDAFLRLDSIFGTHEKGSQQKKGFRIPRSVMTNSDLTRIINSDEIQSALRAKFHKRRPPVQKKNPLRNLSALVKLNPYATTHRRRVLLAAQRAKKRREQDVQKRREAPGRKRQLAKKKTVKKERKEWYKSFLA
jgi:large subunit ribosomal protein L4e